MTAVEFQGQTPWNSSGYNNMTRVVDDLQRYDSIAGFFMADTTPALSGEISPSGFDESLCKAVDSC
jgi:hypothetical protein